MLLGRRFAGLVLAGALAGLAAGLCACSAKSRKLGSGGSPADTLFYDLLGADRGTDYYYRLLKGAYDTERFCYRCTSDPYLVDKAIDAVYRLGGAEYSRLEGLGQVVTLLTDILLEDPSPLAQSQAANSLTRLAVRLPRYPPSGQEDDGRRLLDAVRELDAMHDDARRALRPGPARDPEAARRRIAWLVEQIGALELTNLGLAKDALRPFTTRDYLIDASDPLVRGAIDTALVRRIGELVRMGLVAAVDAPTPFVREEAVRGLKVLGEATAVGAVLARLQIETHPRVRAEAVEFLGRAGGVESVAALLPMLEDPDLALRFKAREALVRIAGQDLGPRRRTWARWARAAWPAADWAGEADAEGAEAPGPAGPG